MASAKTKAVTKGAAKSTTSKAKEATKLKPVQLSEEIVVDSDSESPDDDSSSSSDDDALTRSGAASIAAQTLNGPPLSQKSPSKQKEQKTAQLTTKGALLKEKTRDENDDESVEVRSASRESRSENKKGNHNNENQTVDESSEDESTEESAVEDNVPPPSGQRDSTKPKRPETLAHQVNGVKRKTTSQEETESESSRQDTTETPKPKKARVDNETSRSTGREGKTQTASQDMLPNTQQSSTSQPVPASQIPSLGPIPARPYEPPHGYQPVALSNSTSTTAAEFAGKNVWHITTPIGVPLSSITSLTLDSIRSGKTVLTHKNIEYALTEAPILEASVFLPSKDGYKAVAQTVRKSLSLRPVFTLPTIPARAAARDAGSLASGNIATAAVTTIRPQPKGLKMRFKPPGFGKGNPGVIGEDVHDEEEAGQTRSTFQFPRAVGPSTDGNGVKTSDGNISKKKNKKHKHSEHAPNGLADHVEPAARTPSKVPSAIDKLAAKVEDHTQAAEADDAARRKAEKKARKAAKRKAMEEAS